MKLITQAILLCVMTLPLSASPSAEGLEFLHTKLIGHVKEHFCERNFIDRVLERAEEPELKKNLDLSDDELKSSAAIDEQIWTWVIHKPQLLREHKESICESLDLESMKNLGHAVKTETRLHKLRFALSYDVYSPVQRKYLSSSFYGDFDPAPELGQFGLRARKLGKYVEIFTLKLAGRQGDQLQKDKQTKVIGDEASDPWWKLKYLDQLSPTTLAL